MLFDVRKNKIQAGIVKRHPDGFGFFVADNPEIPDVYIPKHHMNGVMTNDKVEVEIYPEPGGKRFRGEIRKILNRVFKRVIGRFQNLNEMFGVIPDDNNNWGTHLSIPKTLSMDAKPNDLVVAEITGYPENGEKFLGKIIEILGDSKDPQYDTKKVIINHNIPYIFPGDVIGESEHFSKDVEPNKFKHRKDLTNISLITIDGKTAKDFDDAIFVEKSDQGFHLIVAIADVSHYVKIGAAIDREAYQRGTSVYFPNFVVPMLPEVLSNELCSLKPNVYRLCLVADMHFDFQGHNTGSTFYEAVMKSQARVTYGEAQEVIDGSCPPQFAHVKDVILTAANLAKILMAKRFQAGSLDLEIPETEIIVDELGNPVDILRADRIFSHRLIEEMMLIANVEVARFLGRNNTPVLYRIHEPPKLDNIELLNNFLSTFGSSKKLSTKNLQKDITKALHEFSGKPEETILNILTLRSMNQAKYSPDNIGHFGLGFEDYCHFTSPIRRYPDLIVHRVLKGTLKIPGYEIPAMGTLSSSGTFLSACEQRSVKSERQLHSIKKARFMEKHLGEEFEGIVSSVAKFGVFVLLRQFDVDGLIKIEDLGDDHYMFLEEQLTLQGKRSGQKYSIGDLVKIQVASCDVEMGQINFVLTGGLDKFQPRTNNSRNKNDHGRGRQDKRQDKNRQNNHRRDNEKSSNVGSGSQREKILKMLDEKISNGGDHRGNHKAGHSNRKNNKKRGEGSDDRGGSSKTRFSKRPGKSKAR